MIQLASCHLLISKHIKAVKLYFLYFLEQTLISLQISAFEFLSSCDIVFVYFCRKYDQALEYHRQALVLIPQHASTYAAIGYVHSLMGDFESAIDYFHTVLYLQFDLDFVSSNMVYRFKHRGISCGIEPTPCKYKLKVCRSITNCARLK